MAVSREDVLRVAALACLEIAAEDAERMAGELRGILGHVEKLQGLDLTAVTPTSHVVDLATSLRDDQPVAGLEREEALYNAPESSEGLFVVPRVMKER